MSPEMVRVMGFGSWGGHTAEQVIGKNGFKSENI